MEINHETPEWLDFVTNLGGKVSYKSTTVKTVTKTSDKPLINIPLDKLFELYGNLVLNGFTEDEALVIIVGIASNARGD